MMGLKPGTYLLGKEAASGKDIFITVHEGQCGWDCSCCEYDDGTAPCDHERNCRGFEVDGWCDCEGAIERSLERKRDENG